MLKQELTRYLRTRSGLPSPSRGGSGKEPDPGHGQHLERTQLTNGSRAIYPLTAPTVSPSISCRRSRMKITNVGKAASIVPASTNPYWVA